MTVLPDPRVLRLAQAAARERASDACRERVAEPMVMDDAASVAAFHGEDPIVQTPVYRFCAEAMSRLLPDGGAVLDLGCGSGRLLAHLAQARPDVRIVGVDLAGGMLDAGRAAVRELGLDGRVELRRADMTLLPDDLTARVDLVSTTWALHHLPTDDDLRRCLAEIARVRAATGCAMWLFDFSRLRLDATFAVLMDLAPAASARLREDGLASERAAWTASEMLAAMDAAGLGPMDGGPEGMLGHYQAWWAPRVDGRANGHDERWSALALPGASADVLARLRAGMPSPDG